MNMRDLHEYKGFVLHFQSNFLATNLGVDLTYLVVWLLFNLRRPIVFASPRYPVRT